MLPSYAEIVRIHRIAHSCIISILSILENWLHFPFFTCGIFTFGSSGKETSKLCPFGTTENRLDS